MIRDTLLSALIAAAGAMIIWLVTRSLWCLLPGALLFLAMYLLFSRRREQRDQERIDAETAARPTQILAELRRQIAELGKADEGIADSEISERIVDLQKPLTGICDYLADHPQRLPKVRGLHDHYLPGLLQALDVYRRSEPYGLCDRDKLISYLSAMQLAFENLLRQLFADSLAELDGTMAVATRLLEESGLDQAGRGTSAQERSI